VGLGIGLVVALCPMMVSAIGGAQAYPTIKPLRQTFVVPDVHHADISLDIRSVKGLPLYKLECHSAGYTETRDFDYSGDFECRLSSFSAKDVYSTLLTEDVHQSRDWESRGRFFSANLRPPCANISQFGATRNFRLRGMTLTLQIRDPSFANDGRLIALKLTVTANPDPDAQTEIAQVVSLPKTATPPECKLGEYFVDLSSSNKAKIPK
jgi:hypothetical protein